MRSDLTLGYREASEAYQSVMLKWKVHKNAYQASEATCPGSSPVPNINMYAIYVILLFHSMGENQQTGKKNGGRDMRPKPGKSSAI